MFVFFFLNIIIHDSILIIIFYRFFYTFQQVIILYFTINFKTPIHVEFRTILCTDNDTDNDTGNDTDIYDESNQFAYEMIFINININKKQKMFEEVTKNVIDNGGKAIAIIYDDIDDKKSIIFNNLMATY